MLARVRKALVYAEEFTGLCESSKCDARTKLESQVSLLKDQKRCTEVKHCNDEHTVMRPMYNAFFTGIFIPDERRIVF